MRFIAIRFNEEANAADAAGRSDDAERLWRQAVSVDPTFSAAWFNLGLLYKRRRNWRECFLANREAVFADHRNEGAWWNLGIAATALRRWAAAREAWAFHKIPMPKGDGPPDTNFGPAPVRLKPSDDAEVVWGEQVDAARIRLTEVPHPDSGYRFGDIILRDGVPVGERERDGATAPLFDVLELWQPCDLGLFEVELDPAAAKGMETMARAAGWAWRTVSADAGGRSVAWVSAPSEELIRERLGVVAVRTVLVPGPRFGSLT